MGFVKTPDEIARIEHALSHPRFVNGEMLSIDFLSDPEYVASILPPPLEPADSPTLTAMIGRWQSNCVGDFYGGAIYVAARHDGIEGRYVLAMYMDDDVPTIYGRDLFGEPKKLARSELHRSGDQFNAWLERNGVVIMELRGDVPEDTRPERGRGRELQLQGAPGGERHRPRGGRDPHARHLPVDRARGPHRHRHRSRCAERCTTRSTRSRSSPSSGPRSWSAT